MKFKSLYNFSKYKILLFLIYLIKKLFFVLKLKNILFFKLNL